VLPEDSGAADVCNARINNFFFYCVHQIITLPNTIKKKTFMKLQKKTPKAMP
jgi:hypothetical protein